MIASPDIIMIPFLFMIGASFGSFFNVVIYRMPLKQSIVLPASHCTSCKTPIRFIDNIPILSYFLLKGRCRSCGTSFSIRYTLVEFLTAAMTIWFYLIYG